MYDVILWGVGTGYDEFVKYNGYDKVNVIAVVDQIWCKYIANVDGIPVIDLDLAITLNWDYIVVTTKEKNTFENIVSDALKIGIVRDKIVPLRVFEIPFFDFNEYVAIKESNISIIADYCYGGLLSYKFGLPFRSPTVNMFCDNENYYKFICNLEKYLNMPFDEVNDTVGNRYLSYTYPRGKLGGVEWCFNHSDTFGEAVIKWNERVRRFNYTNYIVMMCIDTDEMAYRFDELEIKNKVGFYWKEMDDVKSVVCVHGWNNPAVRHKVGYNFPNYINELVKGNIGLRDIDWMKLMKCDFSNVNRTL